MWSDDTPATLETRAMKKAQRKHSKSIDKIIAKDKIVARDKIKLLLLGQPGAGKSTLVKQLRLYSGDAFSQEEVEASKMALLENIVDAIRLVLTWREELALPWENDVLEDEAQILVSQPSAIVLQERGWKRLLMTLVRLWREDGMQKAYCNMPFGSPAVSSVHSDLSRDTEQSSS
ncbi:hypothetical protein C0Q70_01519 [Pomacea canaliculata]|uniref:Uncharacterized protein n=1 Tax=Pomacea canaliculata TaxID=400727 RepID=A0A2T7PZP5_POMCA|nr:hypothetical protein C0Q70_01519 [Pomacea canaliculata]